MCLDPSVGQKLTITIQMGDLHCIHFPRARIDGQYILTCKCYWEDACTFEFSSFS